MNLGVVFTFPESILVALLRLSPPPSMAHSALSVSAQCAGGEPEFMVGGQKPCQLIFCHAASACDGRGQVCKNLRSRVWICLGHVH